MEGECPACRRSVLWGVLIRQKLGCFGDQEDIKLSEYQVRNVTIVTLQGSWIGGISNNGGWVAVISQYLLTKERAK